MKAKQDFEVYIDKAGEMASAGNLVKVKKGEEVDDKLSDGIIHDLLLKLPDFLELKYENGLLDLSPKEQNKYDFHIKGTLSKCIFIRINRRE